jgi:hypothetical protein
MRPGEGEVLVDLVRQQPQIAPAANRTDPGDLLWSKHGPGRVVRRVAPQDAGSRRDRRGDAVDIRMEAAIRAEPGLCGRRLHPAFDKGGAERVTRLYLRDDLPEDQCWLRAPGWRRAYR